jgi:hypothetical protein
MLRNAFGNVLVWSCKSEAIDTGIVRGKGPRQPQPGLDKWYCCVYRVMLSKRMLHDQLGRVTGPLISMVSMVEERLQP